ncbi:MAG: phospholipase [Actinobacteria bacterium]|nr:phospholipase [Actinomycetota bacterium]MDA8184344.1 phospholipase [Actinomycetota bacterium]
MGRRIMRALPAQQAAIAGRRELVAWAARDALDPEHGSPLLSRRELLAAGSAGAVGLLLAACGSSAHEAIHHAAKTPPAGSRLADVDHVVIIIQENRSFDSYFGTYRGVMGFDDHPAGSYGVFAQPDPYNTTRPPLGKLLPWHFDTRAPRSTAECVPNPVEGWTTYHAEWEQGRMEGFARTQMASPPTGEGPARGATTMGYYTRADLPFYYGLADAFTICDRYHCSVLGETDPNRLMSLSAWIGQDGRNGGVVANTASIASAPRELWTRTWTTMPERLSASGISWKFYNSPGVGPDQTTETLAVSNNVLPFFAAYRDPSSELHRLAFGSTWPQDFVDDVRSGNLPQVSWVLAPLTPVEEDEHPSAPPDFGELFVSRVLSTLASNPAVWSRSVMFLTYDEHGGFFDHVAPPVAPRGTPGEWYTMSPLPAAAGGIAGPIGLGIRVPTLAVSPFSRGGYVDSTVYDHTSTLRFVETRFGVEVPNLSAWRRATTGDLTRAFDFVHQPDTSVPVIPGAPASTRSDALVASECPSNAVTIALGIAPAVQEPAAQTMPTQEPGTAKRRSG